MFRSRLSKLLMTVPLALGATLTTVALAGPAAAGATKVPHGAATSALVEWTYWGTYPTRAECEDVGEELERQGLIFDHACNYRRGEYELRVRVLI
ncbi:hypothetical protein [Plantactinospora endophytica]|uniref:SPOR domain-containing protein n=1 Tax=Plantactinospora endophytica TaxID=673535 RepID=A0ABQ4E0X0_9ACTN|nr:hypothetical protein [Plantactinospora endophytica]GIG87992.1 hypothetical protein Pen02_29280 [Plantactinospora endophytica]